MTATTFAIVPVYPAVWREHHDRTQRSQRTQRKTVFLAVRFPGSTLAADFNAHARSARSGRLSLVRLDELEQAVGAFAKDVQGRRVRNANETGRVERFPRRDRHTRFLQQGVGQIERRAEAVHRQEIADVDEQIKRAGRYLAAEP